jgi:ribonucleoside-diphosphate reductase beta chain
MSTRTSLKTSREGLDHRMVPMRLWRKAKKLGTWNPADIDFSGDRADFESLTDEEQDLLLRLTTQFQAGEESVTYDLLPIIRRMADEGRIEDEMFLTSYLWEEAKHVEGFDRFLREVTQTSGDLEHYFTDAYRQIFLEELPSTLKRLDDDGSPEALADAAVTYQMIVEGVLAETGYEAYYSVLEAQDIMPGMQEFVRNVQRDESRHVGYGVYLLSRLVAEHGDPIWDVIEERMSRLITVAIQHIQDTLSVYDPVPFGLTADQFAEYGMAQFQKRIQRIERAREQTLEDVLYDGAAPSGDGAPGASGDAATTSASLPSDGSPDG